MFKTFKGAHQWLLDLEKKKTTVYSPKQIRAFLRRLNNPQDTYRVVHVGGTSGKGSVCQMLTAILIAAGYKVGTTVSPYVFDPREKVQIQQRYIADKDFVHLVNKYRKLIEKFKLSYFEAFIALTLVYFAQKKVDYAVVEVGLGGRLDATNVFKDPELVIITNIGLDHTEVLGNTLVKIAREKAAIIKNKNKTITGSRLIKKAKYINVKLKIKNLKTNLLGEFQEENARLAYIAAKKLRIKNKDIKRGLMRVKHPGRLEIIKKEPLIIRDGAHNPDKMRALIKSLFLTHRPACRQGRLKPGDKNKQNKKYLLMAIKATKDYQEMIKIITPYFDEIVFTSFSFKSHDPKVLQKEVKGSKVIINPKKAYQQTVKKLKNSDLLLVTGSLYLLGEIFDQ